MTADLIVTKGEIWTGVSGADLAEALAVRGDRIAAVGSTQEIEAWQGPSTTIVDAGGKFVMPGFIDNHTHFVEGGFGLLGVDLRAAKDEAEFGRLIGEAASKLPKGTWITGGRWDHESWPSHQPPTSRMIDPYTPDTPVFVERLDGHMAVANTLALRLAGVDRNTKDVPGGEIVRDARGELTGLLKDAAMELIYRVIPAPSEADRLRAAERALEEAGSLGVTTVNAMCSSAELRVLQKLAQAGKLSVRIYAITPLPDFEALREVGIIAPFGDNFLRIGAVKGYIDGSLGSTTAWFYQPYFDAPQTSGLPADMYFPEGNLKRLVAGADAAGLHVVVHAIGDRANDELLGIYAAVERQEGKRDRRFRVEHAQHLSSGAVQRCRQLGVIASMQPSHVIDDGRWAEKRIGRERLKGTYAFRSLLDAGVVVTFGSDWPVAPLDPLLGVYSAVTRRTVDGKHPEGWVPEQKITLEEALTCYTRNNAYAIFAEDRLGTLTPGKLADVVVLSANPLTIDPAQLEQIKVLRTITGGQTVYAR
jgi:predicted amidohydrolase YtcJ